MLKRVEIENFLTIEKCTIEPARGITAIIGESGSGKSLILKAIDLVLSQKTQTNLVGNFSDVAKISLYFTVNQEQKQVLEKAGITDDEVVFTKIIRPGSAKVYVNHEPISSKAVANLKNALLSIVSQDYRFELFSQEKLLNLLDSQVHSSVKEAFRNAWSDFVRLKDEIYSYKQELDGIKSQHPEILLEAIDKVNPKRGEYEELLNLLNKAKQRAAIKDTAERAVFELYEKENSVEQVLSSIRGEFERLKLDRELEAVANLTEAINHLNEARGQLYALLDQELSQQDLDKINARLFELEKLQRQFGKTIDEIIEQKNKLNELIERREWLEEKIDELKDFLLEKEALVREKAKGLSKERKTVAEQLKNKVLEYLARLNLENSVLQINLKEKQISETGMDIVEILFSANPDIKPDNIEKIASGGEKSRFILALKKALSDMAHLNETVIFDELEAGLSAEALSKLLKLLKDYSEKNQIILVTHTESTLSIADRIYRVKKEFVNGKTISSVELVK